MIVDKLKHIGHKKPWREFHGFVDAVTAVGIIRPICSPTSPTVKSPHAKGD